MNLGVTIEVEFSSKGNDFATYNFCDLLWRNFHFCGKDFLSPTTISLENCSICIESSLNLKKPMKGVKKENLPEKVCIACNRPFAWRKKWEKNWADVKFCSDKCRANKSKTS